MGNITENDKSISIDKSIDKSISIDRYDEHLYLLVIHALGQYQIWAIFNEINRAKDAFRMCSGTCPSAAPKSGIFLYKMKVNGSTPNFSKTKPFMGEKNIPSIEKSNTGEVVVTRKKRRFELDV